MIKKTVIISLFVAQIFFIIYAQITGVKVFCWAPYDQVTQYKLDVILNSRKLSEIEIYYRYRKNKEGFENRSINNLKFLVKKVEKSLKSNDDVKIRMTYSTNKRPEETVVMESPNYEWIYIR